MKVFFEKYGPYLLSLFTAVGVYLYKSHFLNFNQIFDQVTTNALSVSGTLIGFFLTILTIINTITTRRMRFLKDSGLFPRLLNYLNTTIFWHLIVISIGLFLPLIRQIFYLKRFAFEGKVLIVAVIFLSWLLSIRFTRIFIKLLHDPKPVKGNDIYLPPD